MKNKFKLFLKISLILVYLVILAGSTVRMTGSGMGCPDWPKCFGYLIPPSNRSQLDWKQNYNYNKGQIVIINNKLYSSMNQFKSGIKYNKSNWKLYTKHNYSLFNPYHTWIEYINRLIGALSGLSVLVMTLFSFSYLKEKKIIPIFSILTLFLMGLQAWSGKIVVDSNLMPIKITIHLSLAILLVIIMIVLIQFSKKKEYNYTLSKGIKTIIILGFIVTLSQIFTGTQVRGYVDQIFKISNNKLSNIWQKTPPIIFYIHRSFSILVLLIHFYLGYKFFKSGMIPFAFKIIMLMIGFEILTGILMYYFNFPFFTQPLHLLFASILIGAQTYILMEINKTQENDI
jgi:cytochrome c oxidase assembly protein subunit 15